MVTVLREGIAANQLNEESLHTGDDETDQKAVQGTHTKGCLD